MSPGVCGGIVTGAEIALSKLKRLTRWIIILRICQGQVRVRVSWGSDTDFKKGPGPHTQEDCPEEERILMKKRVAKNSLLDGRLHSHNSCGQCSGNAGEEAWGCQSLQCLTHDFNVGMSWDLGTTNPAKSTQNVMCMWPAN